MTRRFWIGLVLTLPVFVLEMGAHIVVAGFVDPKISSWIQFALATPVVLWAGGRFSCAAGSRCRPEISTCSHLIATGTGVAYLYSVVAVLMPEIFPRRSAVMAVRWQCISSRPPSITVLVLLGQVAGTARARTDFWRNPRAA